MAKAEIRLMLCGSNLGGDLQMIDWANRELSTLEGQLAFWKCGIARIFNGPSSNDDITEDVIATIERHISNWRDLMARHNVPVVPPSTDSSS